MLLGGLIESLWKHGGWPYHIFRSNKQNSVERKVKLEEVSPHCLPSQWLISSHPLLTAHTSSPRGKTRKPFDKSWIVTVVQVLWRFLKIIMGITHKITQCNIFKCVMNASQNPIQILGYQISLNKSPTLSSSSFEDLRGPFCRAGFTTPCRHLSTQTRRLLMARWRESPESEEVRWQSQTLFVNYL